MPPSYAGARPGADDVVELVGHLAAVGQEHLLGRLGDLGREPQVEQAHPVRELGDRDRELVAAAPDDAEGDQGVEVVAR